MCFLELLSPLKTTTKYCLNYMDWNYKYCFYEERNICYNKTANCMWIGQSGQNQSICLNLTHQNGDKNFCCKTRQRFDWRKIKMECLFTEILFLKSGLHWKLNKELGNKMIGDWRHARSILSPMKYFYCRVNSREAESEI